MALKENENIYEECKHIKRVKPDAQVTEGYFILH